MEKENRMNRRNALLFLAGFMAFYASKTLAKPNSNFKIPIKIGFLPISDHLIIIAKELFVSQNYELVGVKFSNWADISEALRAGAIDGAFLLAPLGLNLKASGVNIKAVLSAHKNGSALVVNKNINNINDLSGKKIAVPSRFSMHYFLLDKLLNDNKISAQIIDMAPPEMPFALASKQIDAYIVAEPFGQIGVKLGAKNLLLSKEIKPNHICCVLNFKDEILNLPNFNEILNAFKNAAAFIEQNTKESAILGNKIMAQKVEILNDVLGKKLVSYDDLSLSEQDLSQLRDFLVAKNLGSKNLASLNIKDYLL